MTGTLVPVVRLETSALPGVVIAVGFVVRLAVVQVRFEVHVLDPAAMVQRFGEAVRVPAGRAHPGTRPASVIVHQKEEISLFLGRTALQYLLFHPSNAT